MSQTRFYSVEDQQQLLADFAESFGLTVLNYHQPDGRSLEHIAAHVLDPQTGEEGEIQMPSWLLLRLYQGD